ncbi:MAG: AAA family ATPase [Acidimicrobiales bacterium]
MPSFEEQVPDTADELMAAWGEVDAPEEPEVGHLHRPTITLADVGGLQAVKDRLVQSFLAPMQNPELRAHFGKSLRGGLMLWSWLRQDVPGASGRRRARRCVLRGRSPTCSTCDRASEQPARRGGEGQPALRAVLRRDRRAAAPSCAGGAAMRGYNQLLAELDGVSSNNEGTVLAATNHPWDVDPALLRPGASTARCWSCRPTSRPARRSWRAHLVIA